MPKAGQQAPAAPRSPKAAPASMRRLPTLSTPAALILEQCTEVAKELQETPLPSPLPPELLVNLASAVHNAKSWLPYVPSAEAAPADTSCEQANVPLPMPKRDVPTAYTSVLLLYN